MVGMTILKIILGEYSVKVWTGFTWLRIGMNFFHLLREYCVVGLSLTLDDLYLPGNSISVVVIVMKNRVNTHSGYETSQSYLISCRHEAVM
jgi:hypothetical protein